MLEMFDGELSLAFLDKFWWFIPSFVGCIVGGVATAIGSKRAIELTLLPPKIFIMPNSKKELIEIQLQEALGTVSIKQGYIRYCNLATTETAEVLKYVFAKMRGYYIAFLKENGTSSTNIQHNKRVKIFEVALSKMIHKALMTTVIETIFDNSIPKLDSLTVADISQGGIDDSLKWYQSVYESIIGDIWSIEQDWFDDFLPFKDFKVYCEDTSKSWCIQRDLTRGIIVNFERLRRKRNSIMVSMGRNDDEYAIITRWRELFLQTGVTQMLRG